MSLRQIRIQLITIHLFHRKICQKVVHEDDISGVLGFEHLSRHREVVEVGPQPCEWGVWRSKGQKGGKVQISETRCIVTQLRLLPHVTFKTYEIHIILQIIFYNKNILQRLFERSGKAESQTNPAHFQQTWLQSSSSLLLTVNSAVEFWPMWYFKDTNSKVVNDV